MLGACVIGADSDVLEPAPLFMGTDSEENFS